MERIKRIFVPVCGLLLSIFIMPLTAAAADVENPVGESVSHLLLTVVFPVLTAFLLGLLGIVLDKLRQKFNLQISGKQEERLELLAYQGITAVEELAADRVKNNLKTLTGREKLDIALAKLLSAIPEISEERARLVIESMIARTEGVGATRKAFK